MPFPQIFFNTYSPIKIGEANTKITDTSLVSDWNREAKEGRMIVNGNPISIYAIKYNNFNSIEAIELFFKEEILKKITNEHGKEKIIPYLKRTFHQGGFLYPLSASLSDSIKDFDKKTQREMVSATIKPTDTNKEIHIISTNNGFKIQEYVKVKHLYIFKGISKKLDSFANKNNEINPENGNKYIIEGQALIELDFSQSVDKPSIIIESNTINFGHAGLAEKLETRNFFQILVDFFKNLLNANQFKPLSVNDDVENSNQNTLFR